MTKYLLSYREPKDRMLAADTVASWSAWYQGLGAQLLDPRNPVRGSIPL
jgi:hypothetical protein